ncbi:MAG: hypothetical protein QG622_1037 [Actinomycetota bacterium]|nr:hypothetical protein [Actinomycetota bacterium]
MTWTILPPYVSSTGTLRSPATDNSFKDPRTIENRILGLDRPCAVAVVVHRDPGRIPARDKDAAKDGEHLVDLHRVAAAAEAARCGYVLADVREVADDDPVTGPEWAAVWNMAVHVGAHALIISGTPDLSVVEAVAARLRLRIHLYPRTRPGPVRLHPCPASILQQVGAHDIDIPAPSTPPTWAHRSIIENGAITHETVSTCQPMMITGSPDGWRLVPSEISLSVRDVLVDDRWVRTRPTAVIEGGIYDMNAARQLHDVLTDFLAVTGDETEDVDPPQ